MFLKMFVSQISFVTAWNRKFFSANRSTVSLFLQVCPKAGKWTPPQWELLFSSSKLLIFRINQNDNQLYPIRNIMGELFLEWELGEVAAWEGIALNLKQRCQTHVVMSSSDIS